MRVIVVGPSGPGTKGGISSVMGGMQADEWLTSKTDMAFYGSYYDGNLLLKTLYGIWRILWFNFVVGRYDIVHIHMSIKGSAKRKMQYAKIAKRHGKKVILHIHSGNFVRYYQELPPDRQKKLRDCLQSADCVLALSRGWKRMFEQVIGLTNCETVTNGILLSQFPAENGSFLQRPIDLLFLGRLSENKGTDNLLEVLARVKDEGVHFHCVLAGDGPVEEYKQKAAALGLGDDLEFTGWISGQQKLDLLYQSRVMALPSYYEGLPMSILEAMACSEAVISTPIGGIPEAVENSVSGMLVQPGDVGNLYAAVRLLLKYPERAQQMGRRGREIIEQKYDVLKLHRQLYAIYCQVMGE